MQEVDPRRGMPQPESYLDPASETYASSFFDACFERELTRCIRYGDSVTLGLLEVRGAEEPGRPSPELGRLILSRIREVDLAAFRADNSYTLMLVKASADVAGIVGERVLVGLADRYGAEWAAWLGLASYPRDGSSSAALRECAARALEKARETGPNRIYHFPREHGATTSDRPRILVVDDDPRNVKLLEALLLPMGYEVVKASNGPAALEAVQGAGIDVVLLDIMMPGMNGYDVCRRLKSMEGTRALPVILVTALEDVDSKVKGIQAGADEFLTKPVVREELLARTRSLVNLHRLSRNLVNIESALYSLANAVEAKDSYTLGHTQRVAALAVAVGGALGLREKDLSALRLGGILHDVGKIGVPEAVLNKGGPLDEKEWKLMRAHTELGYTICLPLVESIGPALDVIRHHHEKLDGSSYPDGLRGEQISTIARVMGVVDVYDALVSDRPYRKAMPREKALEILRAEVKTGKIDGTAVAALERIVARDERTSAGG